MKYHSLRLADNFQDLDPSMVSVHEYLLDTLINKATFPVDKIFLPAPYRC